jgi:hypothetical protein
MSVPLIITPAAEADLAEAKSASTDISIPAVS